MIVAWVKMVIVKVEGDVGSEHILKRESRGFPDRVVVGSEKKRDIKNVSAISHWRVELPSTELGKSAVEADLW